LHLSGRPHTDIRRAYGSGLTIRTADYEDEPAHQLTFWSVPGKRGIRYKTNADGRVEWIDAGSKSIEYMEGCL
jgi:hypothetical protein